MGHDIVLFYAKTRGDIVAKKSIAERKAQLEAELKKLDDEEQKQEEIRHLIIGRVVSAEMAKNQDVMNLVGKLLEQELTARKERAVMGLQPLPSKRGRPTTTE